MGITVRATDKGYYGLKIREKGEIFNVKDDKAVSKLWMKPLEASKSAVSVGVEFDGDGNIAKDDEVKDDEVKKKGGRPRKEWS